MWSSTVVRVTLRHFPEPQVLAYLDLDDGPRVLARVAGDLEAPAPGRRLRIVDPESVPPTAEVDE